MKVVTPEEMAVMDRRTIKAGISDYELMEKAGTRCARIIMDEIEEDARVLVLCGAGNNGGDGQVIARQLANGGWKVRVLFTSDASKMTPSSERNYTRLKEIGVPCDFYEELNKKVQGAIDDCDVLVDAVFGNGLKDRPLYDKIARLFTGGECFRSRSNTPWTCHRASGARWARPWAVPSARTAPWSSSA